MTLQRFLKLTSPIQPERLRRAMAAALAVEAPGTARAYVRFYCRVLGALGLSARSECDGPSGRATPAAA
jgi:hypothetical protein